MQHKKIAIGLRQQFRHYRKFISLFLIILIACFAIYGYRVKSINPVIKVADSLLEPSVSWKFYEGPYFKFIYPDSWQIKSCCDYNTYMIYNPSSEYKYIDGRSHQENIGYKTYILIHYETQDKPVYYAEPHNLDEFVAKASRDTTFTKLPTNSKNMYAFKVGEGSRVDYYYFASRDVMLRASFEGIDHKTIDDIVKSVSLW